MFWVAVRRWVRVLWVARVSVASCLAGAVLFIGIVQARDLLLEAPIATAKDLGFFYFAEMAFFAVLFGLVLLVVWAMPVHAVARICLNRIEWLTSPYGSSLNSANLDEARAAFDEPAKLVPRILGCACFVVAAIGVVMAGSDLPEDPTPDVRKWLHPALYLISLACFLALFLFYAIRRRRWSERRRAAKLGISPTNQPTRAAGTGRAGPIELFDRITVWALTGLLVLALVVTPILDHVQRAFLVLVLLGVWVPALGYIGSLSFRTRLPMIVIFIAAIAGLDFLIGDNHDLDKRSIRNFATPQLPIREAVDRWRTVNGCASEPGNCPSPIIVVAAGGASRAAFMTASTLGLLLDASCFDGKNETSSRCDKPPAMAQRLFAISSVSGSSLGAAVYAKAYADGITPPEKVGGATQSGKSASVAPPCNGQSSTLWFGNRKPQTWQDCLQTILSEDFLSTVFVGLGFRDVFAFVGKIYPDWADRGRRLEQSWVAAYNRYVPGRQISVGDDKFAGLDVPFASLVSGKEDDNAWRPLLLLNSTSVETGRRIVTSHLVPKYLSDPACRPRMRASGRKCIRLFTDAYDMHEVLNGIDPDGTEEANCKLPPKPLEFGFSLASAAHNSARFPVVSPAGNILRAGPSEKENEKVGDPLGRVVDGGYFDNYGALTAFDLADTLRWDFDLHPFVLLITNDPSDSPNTMPPSKFKPKGRQFGSLAADPVDTVLATRSGHGSTALKFLRGLVDPEMYQDKVCEASPSAVAQPVALGDQSKAENAPEDRSCFGIQSESKGRRDIKEDGEPCFAHITVGLDAPGKTPSDKPKNAPQVSMSWWLSKPVQHYLTDQLQYSAKEFDLVCAAIARGQPEGDVRDLQKRCNDRIRLLTSSEK